MMNSNPDTTDVPHDVTLSVSAFPAQRSSQAVADITPLVGGGQLNHVIGRYDDLCHAAVQSGRVEAVCGVLQLGGAA